MNKILLIISIQILLLLNFLMGKDLDSLKISKWYNGYDAALGLRFDDGLESHVKFVIPKLNEFNIKATFLVNPGRNSFLSSYKNYKDFWENQVPQMGHRLGNHTMHHKGAETVEEAEYEIGEVSKIIWKLYPDKSRLTVFASGGGEEWGGKRWHKADQAYKDIAKKYNLIDLYDGNHPAVSVSSEIKFDELRDKLDQTIAENELIVFCFHQVGSPRIIDYLKRLFMKIDLAISEEEFTKFIEYLNTKRDKVWVVPLVQLYKYQEEYKKSKLELVKNYDKSISYKLYIETDPELYDQELSIKIPNSHIESNLEVKQDDRNIEVKKATKQYSIVNVKPVNSVIEIVY